MQELICVEGFAIRTTLNFEHPAKSYADSNRSIISLPANEYPLLAAPNAEQYGIFLL